MLSHAMRRGATQKRLGTLQITGQHRAVIPDPVVPIGDNRGGRQRARQRPDKTELARGRRPAI
jgi:hypothetical protein